MPVQMPSVAERRDQRVDPQLRHDQAVEEADASADGDADDEPGERGEEHAIRREVEDHLAAVDRREQQARTDREVDLAGAKQQRDADAKDQRRRGVERDHLQARD